MKIVFFQPYIANWREEFLTRFKNEKYDKFDVEIITGYHVSKISMKTNEYRSEIADKTLYSINKDFKYKNQYYPIYFSPFLLVELFKRRPDVIITEGEINIINNISILLYKILFNKAYLWWSLGKVRNRNKNILNRVFSVPMRILLKNAKYILARNTYAKNYYLENGYDLNKIILVPNSMDNQKAINNLNITSSYNLNTNNILFVGSLIKEKNVDFLIEAISVIQKEIEDIKLVIIGSGEEKEKLIQLVDDLNLNENVNFIGAVFENISEYFLDSNLVVLPGMGGLSIQHAMLHARPVICSIADGIEEDLVLNDETGYIITDKNKKQWIKTIKYMLKNKEKTKNMGINAKKHVDENWNMDIMISQMEKAIEGSVLNK